jgi:hypothetical protein
MDKVVRELMRRGRAVWMLAVAGCLAGGCVPKPSSFLAEPNGVQSTGGEARVSDRLRIAVLPLANYTATHDAPDRLGPMLAAAIGAKTGAEIVDPGAVETALEKEPWLLLDRVPRDILDRVASELEADEVVVGSLLSYGYREDGGDRVPQVSLSLRLIGCPGAQVIWSAVHSRDGEDGEWLFGFGRVKSLEQLATQTVSEILADFPVPVRGDNRKTLVQGEK